MKITLNGQTYDVLFFPTSRVTLLPAVCTPVREILDRTRG